MNEYQDNGWMKELKAETGKYDMVWPAEGAQTYKVQHAARNDRASDEATFGSPTKRMSLINSLNTSRPSSGQVKALQALASDGDVESLQQLRRGEHKLHEEPVVIEQSGEEATDDDVEIIETQKSASSFFDAAKKTFQNVLDLKTETYFIDIWRAGRRATGSAMDAILKESRVVIRNETFGGKRVSVTDAFTYVMKTKHTEDQLKTSFNPAVVALLMMLRESPEGQKLVELAANCSPSEDHLMSFIRAFCLNKKIGELIPSHDSGDVLTYWPLLVPAMYFSLHPERLLLRKQYQNDLRDVGNDGKHGVWRFCCYLSCSTRPSCNLTFVYLCTVQLRLAGPMVQIEDDSQTRWNRFPSIRKLGNEHVECVELHCPHGTR